MPLASQRTSLVKHRPPQPVAAYSFDTFDVTMLDDTGRGNDLTPVSGGWEWNGHSGGSGIGSRTPGGIGFQTAYPAPQTVTAFTVMAWVNYSYAGVWMAFARAAYGPNHASWWLQVSPAGQIEAYREPDTTGAWAELVGPTMTVNTWYHAAFVQSSTGGTLYLDGVPVASDSNGAGTYTLSGINLEVAQSYPGNADTHVDDLRIYHRALTQQDIQTLMDQPVRAEPIATPAPLVEYALDEGSGTTSADSSGNGYTLLLQNGGVWTTGVAGSAIAVANNSDIATINDPGLAIKPTTAVTVMAWVYKADWGTGDTWSPIITKTHPSTGDSVTLYMRNNGIPEFHVTTTGAVMVSVNTSGIPGNTATGWYHVAGTYDGSVMKIYLNGQLANTAAQSGAIEYNDTYPWQVGGASHWGEPLTGSVDEVRIYDQALSQRQIQALLNTHPV